jgi:hypothetical protein
LAGDRLIRPWDWASATNAVATNFGGSLRSAFSGGRVAISVRHWSKLLAARTSSLTGPPLERSEKRSAGRIMRQPLPNINGSRGWSAWWSVPLAVSDSQNLIRSTNAAGVQRNAIWAQSWS